MTALYCARWVLPVSSSPISDGALAVEDEHIVGIDSRAKLRSRFPLATLRDLGEVAIIPGLVNCHSHLELTAMRGFLDAEEHSFFEWLRKLTIARLERMTAEDLSVSAAWGACEAVRAGITCLGDSSDNAVASMNALRDIGLRGTVFQESFGPDPRLVSDNFKLLEDKIALLRALETTRVKAGISPHAPYTVSGRQLEMTADYSLRENLPLMMHAAESLAEQELLFDGTGWFADGLRKRNIEWNAPGLSTVAYLRRHRILETRPLLAHCINVDDQDLELLKQAEAKVAHCPRSNAKLGHGRAPLRAMIDHDIVVGLGSDSVASNNSCDLLAEARFAILSARIGVASSGEVALNADDGLKIATVGGAQAMGLVGQIGELREGFQADFVAISLQGTHQIPSYDPCNTLIFASSGCDVLMTVVAGKEIFAAGEIKTIDEERLRARMKEIGEELAS